MSEWKSGVLALEDGSVFRGKAFGAARTIVGEAVFNTSLTGYQEILTDPSYWGQVVTMTAPHIGNCGVNGEDLESPAPRVAGFVVQELSPVVSNWRSTQTLSTWLLRHGIPGLQGVDTRAITRRLRQRGVMKCCLSTLDISDEEALRQAREWTGLDAIDCVREVSRTEITPPGIPRRPLFTVMGTRLRPLPADRKVYRIAALDLGAKESIFARLRYHGFDPIILPADTPFEAIRELNPDGVFLSNGPGDPAIVNYVHKTVSKVIEHYPAFGICLGHQMITHAIGAKTFKLKFGHRGGNQPVVNLETGRVSITSQNHGFAATKESLEERGAVVTEINLNDRTVEGLRLKDRPVFSVQYHPEASPGPTDASLLFDDFYQLVASVKG